jgi:hypothetical protein
LLFSLRTYGELLVFARVFQPGKLGSELRLVWLSEKMELDLVSRAVGPFEGIANEDDTQQPIAAASEASAAPG